MSCRAVRPRLSAFLDGELPRAEVRGLVAHLSGCRGCAERYRTLRQSLDLLAELPRLDGSDGIAARVFDRLEVESRGPGLALLFRPARAARPLMLPSLLPAALVFVAVLAGALALDRFSEPWPEVAVRAGGGAWEGRLAPSGTENNPLFPSSEVGVPQVRAGGAFPDRLFSEMTVGTLFVETVVARDGSVSTVTLLDGDSRQARPLLDALRRERFEPVRLRGRPVAVSVYRLISRMDVRAPLT